MTLGSLFDGSGTCPLAAAMCGITPVWASEIEPYPIRVTQKNFPGMKHLGDITQLNGAEIEPVDIVTFGSPCQDLSTAGAQKGLMDGKRSNLFFEAIRIIKEMRNATHGKYPRYAVWENVPGAFSSNQGRDFLAVLRAFVEAAGGDGADVPEPASKGGKLKWGNAGSIVGEVFSIAWRVLDAKYWGVPQRRRRIFLVCDFAGERAGEILFKREGLRGNFAQSRETRKEATADAVGSTGGSCVYDARGNGDGKIVPTLTGDHENRITDYTALAVGNGQLSQIYMTDTAGTLNCMHDQQAVLIVNEPVCAFMGGQGAKAGGIGYSEEVSPTLKSVASGSNTVPDVAYWLKKQWRYIVRRLTPLDCCRLQGFPDWWEDGADGSDSARYKMWGNGMALPCVLYVMEGIVDEM